MDFYLFKIINMSESNNLIKVLQEFQNKQESLTTGYLVLVNDQVNYFSTKKEWDSQKEELLALNRKCYQWVDCEKWHHLKNKSNN